MEQQSSPLSENSEPFINPVEQNMEEGEVVQVKHNFQKVKITKNKKQPIQGSDSEWSWESIQDLKGVDLKNLQADEQQHVRIEPEHKQKPKLKVVFPQKPTNIENLTAKYVGKVMQKVGDLLIVTADLKQSYQVVDLDGWVCDNNKKFIGFVIDVFGKIQSPFYAIKPQQNLENMQSQVGQQIFYIQGTKILNQDQVKSIQSKNNKDFEAEQQSSEQDKNEEKQMSVQAPEIYKEHKNHNLIQNRRHRKNSFDHGERHKQRQRTRQNHKAKNWNMRQTNEQYLQNMYAMHYNQMMQFYNPNYQANSSSVPPPYMTPAHFMPGNQVPNYIPGNQVPNFMPGNQMPNFVPGGQMPPFNNGNHNPPYNPNQNLRQNSFIPPTNYQNQGENRHQKK